SPPFIIDKTKELVQICAESKFEVVVPKGSVRSRTTPAKIVVAGLVHTEPPTLYGHPCKGCGGRHGSLSSIKGSIGDSRGPKTTERRPRQKQLGLNTGLVTDNPVWLS
ncbi:hypothetical protein BC936DRAFT_140192, partial [Jimgerdemannia flammicorona]